MILHIWAIFMAVFMGGLIVLYIHWTAVGWMDRVLSVLVAILLVLMAVYEVNP